MSESCWVIVWSSGATHSNEQVMHCADSTDARELALMIRNDGIKSGSQPIGVGKITLKPTRKP